MELVAPARLPEDTRERVRSLAREVFLQVGCAGMARCDFFVEDPEGERRVLVNELNTIPGLHRDQRLREAVRGERGALPRAAGPAAGARARAPRARGPLLELRLSIVIPTRDRPGQLRRGGGQRAGADAAGRRGGRGGRWLGASRGARARPARAHGAQRPAARRLRARATPGSRPRGGRYVTFLDDDNLLLPDMAERSLAALERSRLPPPVAVVSGVEVVRPRWPRAGRAPPAVPPARRSLQPRAAAAGTLAHEQAHPGGGAGAAGRPRRLRRGAPVAGDGRPVRCG